MVVSHHQSILGNLKVLLVEDEEKVREYIAKSLRYIVSEVQEASNGKEALKILDTFSPDIIITDLEMPVMNGVEFIKTLRKRDKNICIAVLTAHSTNEYLINLVDMHIEQFIIKPINFDKMIVVLEKCQKVIINKVEQNLYSF
ncbi:MAG: response regulator, partial [Sulfurospirillum sp.]|nr:response regulator [Sulfurospirillum sp.]